MLKAVIIKIPAATTPSFYLRSEQWGEPISESYLYLAHLNHELEYEVAALPSLD